MKLFVLVDYQNDFVNENVLGFKEAELIDTRLASKVLEATEDEEYLIATTYDTHGQDYLNTREGKHLPIIHTIFKTYGWQLYGKTAEAIKKAMKVKGVCELYKKAFGLSAGNIIYLKEWLQMQGYKPEDIKVIELGGVVGNMCVISVAVSLQAEFYNAEIIIHDSLIASFDGVKHQAALVVMEGLQMQIVRDK